MQQLITLNHLYQWVGLVALVVSAALGLLLGGREGRVVAFAMIVAWFASPLVFQAKLQGVEIGLACVDAALLSVLLWVALRSTMWWPMWAAAMLGLIMSLHLAATIDPGIWGRALYVAESVFSYGALASLGVGSLVEGRWSRIAVGGTRPVPVASDVRADKIEAAPGIDPAPPSDVALALHARTRTHIEREIA